MLARTVTCLDGAVEIELLCEPVFDYGRDTAEWRTEDDGHVADATAGELTIRLRTDMALGVEGGRVRARHILRAGEQLFCSLSWAEELAGPASADEAEAQLTTTAAFWRTWLDRARPIDHRWREPIERAALTIKGLTYMPTGALVAALTTSLPETPGGERNWDYRYAWMRDATFTLRALHWLNLDWEADEFMQFVADLEPDADGALQIMYGIDGRRDLTESTRDDLSGYAGARPVRIGNGAFDQRQNDVYGAVLDSILLHTRRSQRLPRRLWPIVESQAACATKVWREPDQGIWEARGAPQHYVSSKLMGWVALDRAAKLAEIGGEEQKRREWQATADEIRADILEHGTSSRGVLRQHYGTDALDASTLLAALFGFLPADDPVLRATVLAIADELTEDGFVLRYRTEETDDGLSGKEGTFVICSFWLVSALAEIGAAAARPRPDGATAPRRLAARPLRRGVRHRHRPPSRQLPAGLLPPRAARGRGADHPRGTPRRVPGLSAWRSRPGHTARRRAGSPTACGRIRCRCWSAGSWPPRRSPWRHGCCRASGSTRPAPRSPAPRRSRCSTRCCPRSWRRCGSRSWWRSASCSCCSPTPGC